MKTKHFLIQLLIFTTVQAISIQLLFDPWSQERFERMSRENARLFNPLLQVLNRIDFIREAISILGILSSLMYLFGSKFFGQLTILWLVCYWVIFFNFNILRSERFFAYVLPGTFGICSISNTLLKTL
ncbi:unnamed protein product (macronuclear) [Paramecium tetraurelia]|uniref:Uncharacterized protein n=1 Tax=Paramecium tetraurelia TaxID=5888 RepID=A0CDU5_PARTE|nr:uncharacterized protein GSPATT00007174001 [Paramecium tetraurelia]CAK68962.1 unnamed protein product [Paramecium tetraurelia]|eukprot:XP_001436359.1 hypothetical protein (macronuclear) [Paramecium tetraurelia strain d4-2]